MTEVERYTPADFRVPDAALNLMRRAVPDETVRAYRGDWGRFETWCAAEGRTALPATPETFAAYVAHLVGQNKAPATIDRAMGVIRAAHAAAGHKGQPDREAAQKTLKGWRLEWSERGGRVRKATPAVITAIRAMVDTCDPGTPAGIRDRAVILLGFSLMARRSELSGLDIADIGPDGDEGITVFIRKSKTDKEARGAEVAVLYGSHPQTCPVRAVRAWLRVLAEAGITEGPLLRPVDRHGRIGGMPLASGRKGERLTGHSVSEIIRTAARRAGLPDPERYSGHSVRSGAPTSAYAAGAPVSAIAETGRWSPRSPVVLGYIRAVDKWKNHPMRGVGL